jgi:hypothetical protein
MVYDVKELEDRRSELGVRRILLAMPQTFGCLTGCFEVLIKIYVQKLNVYSFYVYDELPVAID